LQQSLICNGLNGLNRLNGRRLFSRHAAVSAHNSLSCFLKIGQLFFCRVVIASAYSILGETFVSRKARAARSPNAESHLGKNALKNQYTGACPYRKTADTFAGHALERDQEKWSAVFRRNQVYADCVNFSAIPLYTSENDRVHQLELIQLKLIVI
jgi:hypothetical protein